jgi:uncharacterized lipoprotein YmbA
MNKSSLTQACFAVGFFCFGLAGCSFLKPSGVTPRSFMLTPLSTPPASPAQTSIKAVGVGFVRLPGYLFSKSMAMRQGASEVVYLDTALWAERLDSGLQRVIAANLATLMPTTQMRLSTWQPEEVSAELYVTVERFDVDVSGECALQAWWRIAPAGGGEVWKAGQFQSIRTGPAPNVDPDAATALMSALTADLSRDLAQALASVAP